MSVPWPLMPGAAVCAPFRATAPATSSTTRPLRPGPGVPGAGQQGDGGGEQGQADGQGGQVTARWGDAVGIEAGGRGQAERQDEGGEGEGGAGRPRRRR